MRKTPRPWGLTTNLKTLAEPVTDNPPDTEHRNNLRRMQCRKSGKAPPSRRPLPPDWAAAQAPFTHHLLRAGRQSAALPTRHHFIGGHYEPQSPPRPPPALSELGSPVNLAAGDCARSPPPKPPAGEPRHSPTLPDAGIPVPTRDCRRLSYRRPYLPAVAGPRPTSKRARPSRNSGLPDSPHNGTIGPLRHQRSA